MLVRTSRTETAGRAGVLAFELILVLPLLLMVILAMVQFSLLLTARQELLAACREGARVASHGGSRGAVRAEVEATVHRLLGHGRLSGAEIRICWHPDDPDKPENGRERVEVVVAAPAAQAAPNFLGWAGFTLGNKHLMAATVMNVE